MEDQTLTVDDYLLQCPICHCSFKKPRVLPCGHNFCENCLKTQWQASGRKDHLECSMCKTKANVSDGDITQFMLNKPLLEQVEEARHIVKLTKQKAKKVRD